jgi:hypothetical protein
MTTESEEPSDSNDRFLDWVRLKTSTLQPFQEARLVANIGARALERNKKHLEHDWEILMRGHALLERVATGEACLNSDAPLLKKLKSAGSIAYSSEDTPIDAYSAISALYHSINGLLKVGRIDCRQVVGIIIDGLERSVVEEERRGCITVRGPDAILQDIVRMANAPEVTKEIDAIRKDVESLG